MSWIDSWLNRITMYRLILYYLAALGIIASVLSLFHVIGYQPFEILFSGLFFIVVCWAVNEIFAKIFNAPSNPESTPITALILALIITPPVSLGDTHYYLFAVGASLLAVASKYILAIGKKHIFNPAAVAVVITGLVFNQGASWWIGTTWLLPFTIIGGFLIVRKIRRGDMAIAFLLAAFGSIGILFAIQGGNVINGIGKSLLETPIVFFATVMLTEPLTLPPTKELQVSYGILAGLMFSPFFHVGQLYSTPELALVTSNVFSYAVSPKNKLIATLKEKIELAPNVFEFVFNAPKKIPFTPGQYLEWTLGHSSPDTRGSRRYFTISSAPASGDIRIGVKFYENSSSYKVALLALKPGERIVASQLAGDFVMPHDPSIKMAWIAGGIGITPFMSMVRDLEMKKQQRDVALLYVNRTVADIAYKAEFDSAVNVGVKTIYAITGVGGKITDTYIREMIPDFAERMFYISGPNAMVLAYEKILASMGVSQSQIIVDYFPGF